MKDETSDSGIGGMLLISDHGQTRSVTESAGPKAKRVGAPVSQHQLSNARAHSVPVAGENAPISAKGHEQRNPPCVKVVLMANASQPYLF